MSLIKLANGHKYEIEQPNEGEGMMRNRRRNTVQLTSGRMQNSLTPSGRISSPTTLKSLPSITQTTRRRMNRMNS